MYLCTSIACLTCFGFSFFIGDIRIVILFILIVSAGDVCQVALKCDVFSPLPSRSVEPQPHNFVLLSLSSALQEVEHFLHLINYFSLLF